MTQNTTDGKEIISNFHTQLKQTVLEILNKDTFTDDDDKRLRATKKLLKKLRRNEEEHELEKLKIDANKAKFTEAMNLLKESGSITKLSNIGVEILQKRFKEKPIIKNSDEPKFSVTELIELLTNDKEAWENFKEKVEVKFAFKSESVENDSDKVF